MYTYNANTHFTKIRINNSLWSVTIRASIWDACGSFVQLVHASVFLHRLVLENGIAAIGEVVQGIASYTCSKRRDEQKYDLEELLTRHCDLT